MRIERFEDIEGWKMARELARRVYLMSRSGALREDAGLCDQLRRASISVMLNVAEGFDGGGNVEFVRFLRYAQRSCNEVQSGLYVALDQAYLDEPSFSELYRLAQTTHALIGGFIKYLTRHPQTKN